MPGELALPEALASACGVFGIAFGVVLAKGALGVPGGLAPAVGDSLACGDVFEVAFEEVLATEGAGVPGGLASAVLGTDTLASFSSFWLTVSTSASDV